MNVVVRLLAVAGMASSALVLVACTGPVVSSPSVQSTQPTTSLPTATTAAPGTSSPEPSAGVESRMIGPDGYGGLKLTMPSDQALQTGVVIADGPLPEPCGYYRFRTSPPGSTDVLVSVRLGIVMIDPREGVHTPEGIGTGSSKADLRAAYPNVGFDSSGTIASTRVPGNPNSLYRFDLDSNSKVGHILIQTTNGDCAG
jgi:hypothetical protein